MIPDVHFSFIPNIGTKLRHVLKINALCVSFDYFSNEQPSPEPYDEKEQKKKEKQRLEREKKEQKEKEKKRNEMHKKFKVGEHHTIKCVCAVRES